MSRRLRSLDLNLVPVLRALLAERNVTRAAARIGLSQPATSNALSRLRDVLGDALLVKTGQTMVRTPFADHLLPMLEATCNELERLLHHEVWSADTVKRQFVVVMADYLAIAIAKDLRIVLKKSAPNVTVRFAPIGATTHAELVSGKIDVAYLGQSAEMGRGINVDPVSTSVLQGIVSPEHPFATLPPKTFEDFISTARIGIDIPTHLLSDDQSGIAELFGSSGVPLRYSTDHLSLLPTLAMNTGALAIVPSTLAAYAAADRGLIIINIPEQTFQYHLRQYWSNRFRTDPGHRWICDVLMNLILEFETTLSH